MTRDRANEVLFLWKVGAELFPSHVINTALYMTGDLDGRHLEADARLVFPPLPPAWLEGVCVESGADDGEGRANPVLATAGATSEGTAK